MLPHAGLILGPRLPTLQDVHRVRMVDEDGVEVAAWDAEEVVFIQEVEEPGDRANT